MTINTFVGKAYVITTAEGCTVSTPEGLLMLTAPKGQSSFVGIDSAVVISDDAAVVVEVSFNVAPFAFAGGGGGVPLFESGVLRVAPLVEGMTLQGGIMYTVTADEALDLSGLTLPAEADECSTCELVLDYTSESMVLWPESWAWVNGVEVSGDAPALQAGKRYFFAIRTVMGETVINHYLTSDL